MFQFTKYIQRLCEHNKFVQTHKFTFATCSGLAALQGAISRFRSAGAFIVANDVCNGGTVKMSGGWQQQRVFTFFIMKRCEIFNEESREAAMEVCREVRRQFLSKILYDHTYKGTSLTDVLVEESDLTFNVDEMPSSEYPDMQLDNCCGLNVTVKVAEPVNLCYEKDEWI